MGCSGLSLKFKETNDYLGGKMMKRILTTASILTVTSALLNAPVAIAGDDGHDFLGGDFSGWVSGGTDRVFRGESETDDGEVPSFQGMYTWTHNSGWYAGYWAGTNKFHTVPSVYAESGPYIGKFGSIGNTGFSYNIFAFQYYYHGETDGAFDYAELWMNLSYQLGDLNLNLEVSPTLSDWFGINGLDGLNVALTGKYDAGDGWTFSGTLGKQDFDKTSGANSFPDWVHWDVGINKNFGKGWDIDVRYHDTDFPSDMDPGEAWDSKFVVNVSKSF